jgi:hypothetical protein
MNKNDRKEGDNWFNYHRYNHVHETVLDSFNGYFLSNAFYSTPINTATELQLEVEFELLNGYEVLIQKWATVKQIDSELMCQTRKYKYLARNPITKHQMRYCSPHFGREQEKENWDYFHHKHIIQYDNGRKGESVIIYTPFKDPENHKVNQSYFTTKDHIRYSFKKDSWPQVEDFLNEVVLL